MKHLVRVLFLSAALAGAFVLARQQKLLKPIVRYFRAPVPLGEYRDPTLDEIAAYRESIGGLLDRKDYPGLAAAAKKALQTKARFANGTWELSQFHDALTPRRADPDAVWLARMQQLNAWIAAQPAEGAAYIAMADLHISYAWRARGSGYAPTVTPEGWRLFRERLTLANQMLDRCATVAQHDPEYWHLRHIVSRGLDWPRRHADAYLGAGLKVEPQYDPLYTAHAMFLLPRWGGQPGEMERFAVAATKVPGGLGDEVYGWIAGSMDDLHGDLFRATKLEWPRVEAGCKALAERYPDDPSVLSGYAMLACRAGDTPTAQRLFEDLDDRVDLRIWKNVENYRKHYNHANPGEPK